MIAVDQGLNDSPHHTSLVHQFHFKCLRYHHSFTQNSFNKREMKNLKNLFRAVIICLLLSSIVPVDLMSQAEECINSYNKAFNSDNNELMVQFYQKYKSPLELKEESAEVRAEGIQRVKKMMGILVPDKIKIINDFEAEQVVKSSKFKRWFALHIEMDPEHPQYYSGISMMPTKSPAAMAKKAAKARKKTEPADHAKPQTPNPPYPYKEEFIKIVNPHDGTQLAGTLTIPKGRGKHPVICLITGGSPFDRDQSIGDHHPYKVWADYLTRVGFATLRMDDRGIGESEGSKMSSSYQTLSDDILAAVSFLKNHNRIDSESIGLLGHSQGSSLSILTAKESIDIEFIILLGGLGMTLIDNIAFQQAEQSFGTEEINLNISNQMRSFIQQKLQNDSLDKAITTYISTLEVKDRILATDYYNEIKQIIRMLSSTPMGRDALIFHPNQILENIQIPVLIVTGGYDGSIINHPSMKRALVKADNQHFSIVEVEKVNHMLQRVEKHDEGDPLVYMENDETVNPEVLRVVKEWLLEL